MSIKWLYIISKKKEIEEELLSSIYFIAVKHNRHDLLLFIFEIIKPSVIKLDNLIVTSTETVKFIMNYVSIKKCHSFFR